MFIGRERELKKLNELYKSGNFEMPVIYGRRRIGKTTLINEFIKGKETIYFSAIEANARVNLENLSQSILSVTGDYADGSTPIFDSFAAALDKVFRAAKTKRIILVMDEYPYLANSYKPISSLLQDFIDKNKDTSRLFLILCGSSLSFMENQVLGYKSPLFGRRTAQFKLEHFDFKEARSFFPKYNLYDAALAYGITGGIPLYMSKINDSKSITDNLKDNFFDSSAYLFDEPTNLIKQECREPAQYNSIIQAVASGASRLNEIASKIETDTSTCSNYLKMLLSIGIIKKEYPFKEENIKKTIYTIADTMFLFWYRFIPGHIALINKGSKDKVYSQIEKDIPAFMGFVFEDICKQYMWQLNLDENSPVDFIDIGRWWGNDPINKCETEIDLMAAAADNSAIFCECKWAKNKTEKSVLDDLFAQSKLFHYNPVQLYLFSKTGFTKGCIESAEKMGNVRLITFAEMFK